MFKLHPKASSSPSPRRPSFGQAGLRQAPRNCVFSVTRPGDFEVIKPWDWGCCFFLHEHRSFCFGKRGEQRLMMDGSEL
jgi:hypothetical protein